MLLNGINETTFSYNQHSTNQLFATKLTQNESDQRTLNSIKILSQFEIEDEVNLLKMVKLPSNQNSFTQIKKFQNNFLITSNHLNKNSHRTDHKKEFNHVNHWVSNWTEPIDNRSNKLYKSMLKINDQQTTDNITNLLPSQLTFNFLSSSQITIDKTSSNNIELSLKNSFQSTRSPIALPISKSKQLIDLLNSTKSSIKSMVLNKNETMSKLINSTETNNDINYQYPSYIKNTATFIFIIILIFGTIGNVLVSVIIIKSKDLRNTTNYFLINLSIADLLVIIVCMPTVLIELHSKPEIWLLGEFMCKTIPYVEMSVAHASILTMLAISFERFYAICKPLKVSYKCTKLRAVLIIIAIWIIALISTLPLLFIAKQSSAIYLDGTEVEVCLTQANDNWSKAFFLIIITLFFFLPLCVLVIIYVAITKRLCTKENISYTESVQMRARRQVVIMLATVICCFFICLLPFRLFTLFLLFINAQTLDSIGMESYYVYLYISRVMLYLNSALNPALYSACSSKFRNAFVQTLCCQNLSNTNRMLIRQSTFNTTTTTMSLTNNSGLNRFLNNFSGSNFCDLNNLNKYKRNSIQTCSLKQSHSVDINLTNLRQMNFKRNGRQASLQQFCSTSTAGLLTKDENDNKISHNDEILDKSEFNNDKFNEKDKSLVSKRLIKQKSFVCNDEIDQVDEQMNEINRKSDDKSENDDKVSKNKPEVSSNVNKKQYTINCELKVVTLEDDLNSVNLSLNLDGKKEQNKRFNLKRFKFYRNIANCVNKSNFIKVNERTNNLKENIDENDETELAEHNNRSNGEASKESNV